MNALRLSVAIACFCASCASETADSSGPSRGEPLQDALSDSGEDGGNPDGGADLDEAPVGDAVTDVPSADADDSTTTDSSSGEDSALDSADGAPDVEDIVCRDVDLLFVIDNSASMGDNQQSLIASFPGFVEAMREELEHSLSFHVGIVTTDDQWNNGESCTEIGSLVTKTSGIGSSNATCGPYRGETRYIDGLDPNLEASFACAALVGVGGSDNERVMRALLNAVSPEFNAPGACNEGFLRPDSLLIIVIVTDEDDVDEGCDDPFDPSCVDSGSGGSAPEWMAEFAASRPNWEGNTIVMSLLGRRLDNTCGAQVAARLIGFTNRFGENGYLADVCAENYDQYFRDVLPLLNNACKI